MEDHTRIEIETDEVMFIPMNRLREYAACLLGEHGDEGRAACAVEILANLTLTRIANEGGNPIEAAQQAHDEAWDEVHNRIMTLAVLRSENEEASE